MTEDSLLKKYLLLHPQVVSILSRLHKLLMWRTLLQTRLGLHSGEMLCRGGLPSSTPAEDTGR